MTFKVGGKIKDSILRQNGPKSLQIIRFPQGEVDDPIVLCCIFMYIYIYIKGITNYSIVEPNRTKLGVSGSKIEHKI